MAAITDLAAASSIAAADLLVVNQSGTDRKAAANKFAIAGSYSNTATNFAGVTVGGTALGITKYDSKFTEIRTTEHLLADDAVWLMPAKEFAMLLIGEGANGNYALVIIQGGINTVISIAKSAGVTTGSDPDGTLNIYYDAGNAKYAVRNRLGSLTGLRVIMFDMAA